MLRRLTTSMPSAVTTAMFTPQLHWRNAGANQWIVRAEVAVRSVVLSGGRPQAVELLGGAGRLLGERDLVVEHMDMDMHVLGGDRQITDRFRSRNRNRRGQRSSGAVLRMVFATLFQQPLQDACRPPHPPVTSRASEAP